jgi:hypothetical protein
MLCAQKRAGESFWHRNLRKVFGATGKKRISTRRPTGISKTGKRMQLIVRNIGKSGRNEATLVLTIKIQLYYN